MALIKNGMNRILRLQRPNDGKIVTSYKTRWELTINIPPGGQAEVPFWDKIKTHPIYKNLLAQGKISVGKVDPTGDPNGTSLGDTLTAPPHLNPDEIKRDAEQAGLHNLKYENEPAPVPEVRQTNKVVMRTRQKPAAAPAPAPEPPADPGSESAA